MTEGFLFPHISSPSRITPRSRTLINNIFSNNIEHDTLSGNITTTISDHFAQYLILKNLSHKQDLKKDISMACRDFFLLLITFSKGHVLQ